MRKVGPKKLGDGATVERGQVVKDKKKLIDIHYGAIAAKAVMMKPKDLTVQEKSQEEFEKQFGVKWSKVMEDGLVYNAMDGAKKLGITADEMGKKYDALKKGEGIIKFGGGFYCGKVDDIYVINGFYMNMRSKFTAPGTSIYYYEVEWPTEKMSWADFRGKLLGPTDPASAPEGSLRQMIYSQWSDLGLKAQPDTGDNGVHASASPFEALAERSNWLRASISKDAFGKALLASGVAPGMAKEWFSDPQVEFEGGKKSLFDLLEDLDAPAPRHDPWKAGVTFQLGPNQFDEAISPHLHRDYRRCSVFCSTLKRQKKSADRTVLPGVRRWRGRHGTRKWSPGETGRELPPIHGEWLEGHVHSTGMERWRMHDGVDYHFVPRDQMEQMISEGQFLESAEVHGNLYGTSFRAIEDICSAGRHCLLDIDVEGVRSLKAYLEGQETRSHFVEVLPEGGIATLEARLRARGVDDEESIQRRLNTARREMKEYGSIQWDSTILSVENHVDEGAAELLRIATRLVGFSEAKLAEEDEPLESPEPEEPP
ncbi:Guanylate kinase 1 (OsGK1) (GMP kinase 1), partial [Durusdinium trenchii]